MKRPLITLLTDFGSADHYVAAMKGVILSICPGAELVDITHEVQPFQIAEGAYLLAQAWKYFPAGSIHVVVVDPGVGSSRRAVLVEAGGHRFVGPDNGVFSLALDGVGSTAVRQLTETRYFRHPVSSTFHGRDIFAPVAGHVANGVAVAEFGPWAGEMVQLPATRPLRVSEREWVGAVLHVDRFGNIVTNLDWKSVPEIGVGNFVLKAGQYQIDRYAQNYASAEEGELFILRGSGDYLEISLRAGSARKDTGISVGDSVRLTLW